MWWSHITADQLSNILWNATILVLVCMGMCAGIASGLPAPVDKTKVDLSKASFLRKLTGSRVYYYWWKMINAIGCNWGNARNFADPKQLAILNVVIKAFATALVSMRGAALMSDDGQTHTDAYPDPEVTHVDPKTHAPVITIPTPAPAAPSDPEKSA